MRYTQTHTGTGDDNTWRPQLTYKIPKQNWVDLDLCKMLVILGNSSTWHVTWQPLQGILSSYPVMQSSLSNSFNSLIQSDDICISKLTIIGSDNGLSPGLRQAIIWTNDGILLIRTFRTNFSEIVSEIHTFSLKKMHFKMSSGKWRPSCRGLNVLKIGYPQMKSTVAWFSNELQWLDLWLMEGE